MDYNEINHGETAAIHFGRNTDSQANTGSSIMDPSLA